jgi:hypothetical protein
LLGENGQEKIGQLLVKIYEETFTSEEGVKFFKNKIPILLI